MHAEVIPVPASGSPERPNAIAGLYLLVGAPVPVASVTAGFGREPVTVLHVDGNAATRREATVADRRVVRGGRAAGAVLTDAVVADEVAELCVDVDNLVLEDVGRQRRGISVGLHRSSDPRAGRRRGEAIVVLRSGDPVLGRRSEEAVCADRRSTGMHHLRSSK